MPKRTPPRIPDGLMPDTAAWVAGVMAEWQLEDHHNRMLVLAAQAFDEAQVAAAAIRKDGILVVMPSGAKRPHPAIRIANEARATFARLLRELDLDLDSPKESRPPSLRSIAGGRHDAT